MFVFNVCLAQSCVFLYSVCQTSDGPTTTKTVGGVKGAQPLTAHYKSAELCLMRTTYCFAPADTVWRRCKWPNGLGRVSNGQLRRALSHANILTDAVILVFLQWVTADPK
jgi:hypothetical protein